MKALTTIFTALATCILVVATTACATKSSGDPVSTNEPSDSLTSPPRSTSQTSQNPFTGIQSCKLLNEALNDFDFPEGERNDTAGPDGCQAQKLDYGVVGFSLQSGGTLADYPNDPSRAHRGNINGRPSIIESEGIGADGACGVAMEVPPQSRAIIEVTLQTGSTDEACDFVKDVGESIEPMLPNGE